MKKKTAFLTGIAGFAGSYLCEYLLSKGFKIYGLLAPKEKTNNISHLVKEIRLDRFDILKLTKLTSLIKKIRPDHIYHLAAFASVGQSFEQERLVYDINFTGTQNLFESVINQTSKPAKLVFVSSSDVYGHFKPNSKTLKEDQPFNPMSSYAISKAAGEYLAVYHYKRNNLPIVRVRAFNHTGPKQTDNYVVPSFCRQIAQIEKGKNKPVMAVGDLSARRDLSDVRDIIRGYYLAALNGTPGDVYQLCSSKSIKIKTVLDKLLKISDVKIKVKVDKSRFRKTDIPVLRGDNKKAIKKLGWHQDYSFDKTLQDTLQYWREKT